MAAEGLNILAMHCEVPVEEEEEKGQFIGSRR